MEFIINRLVLNNWQRKLVSLIAAIIVWFFVNYSITDTKMIRNIPIRIVNLPADKTIIGLLPNGILNKKIHLTLTGTKDVIDELEPGDIEVLIDASTIDHNDWIVQITKKNLVSLNPSIDLSNNITNVMNAEFVLKLNRLVTMKIPVTILPPVGDPPPGYQFLDIWPQKLTQTLSGPEEELQKLNAKGFELSFDLNEITKDELDKIKGVQNNNEISYLVPDKWKKLLIPYRNHANEEINDPAAQQLRIDFIKEELLPIEREIPLQIFFPVATSDKLNPSTLSFAETPQIKIKNGIPVFTVPLFAKNVSKTFLDFVKNNLQIVVIAAPKSERDVLEWSYEVIDPQELEDTYVAYMNANYSGAKPKQTALIKKREQMLRNRFKDYTQQLSLWIANDHQLNLEGTIKDNKIVITDF